MANNERRGMTRTNKPAPPSQILDYYWQGGYTVLLEKSWFADRGITHCVSIGNQSPAFGDEYPLKNYAHDVDDVIDVEIKVFLVDAVEFIYKERSRALLAGQPFCVYTHCHAGVSRSSCVTIAYLMTWLRLPYDQSLAFVRHARKNAQPNTSFVQQLVAWEKEQDVGGCDWLRRRLEDLFPGMDEHRQRDLTYLQDRLCNKENPSKLLSTTQSQEDLLTETTSTSSSIGDTSSNDGPTVLPVAISVVTPIPEPSDTPQPAPNDDSGINRSVSDSAFFVEPSTIHLLRTSQSSFS
jgi:hypothetical protein